MKTRTIQSIFSIYSILIHVQTWMSAWLISVFEICYARTLAKHIFTNVIKRNNDLTDMEWVGVTNTISPVPSFSQFLGVIKILATHAISRSYLAEIAAVVVTSVKCRCDLKNLTCKFARSKISLTEKLTNRALVTPPQDMLWLFVARNMAHVQNLSKSSPWCAQHCAILGHVIQRINLVHPVWTYDD